MKTPKPWTLTEDRPLMLTVSPSESETFLFDYIGFWAQRKGDDVELKFGVATVKLSVLDEDLIVTEFMEGLAEKKIRSIQSEKGRLTLEVVIMENEEGESSL